MVKILNSGAKKGFRSTEQYNDCSSMLKADEPSLEELDPAILSCGLPAIMLSDIQPRVVVPRIRYSPSQLQAIRKSSLSFRRPAIVDDPRVAQFAIWKPVTASNQSRRGCRPYAPHSEPKDDRDDDKGSHTKDKPLERSNAQQKHHSGRENGFVAPRFRRNFEFSNRSQYAIVRSHAGDEHNGPQEAAMEDEPEWMAAGPTSRLDTIELRGFDDDISPNASLDKAPSSNNSSDPKLSSASNISTSTSGEKHVSFYDDLQHYEHVHPQKHQRGGSQGRDDVESVATSTTSSPPAKSTPTKKLGGEPNNSSSSSNNDKLEAGGIQKQKSPQLPHNGINVHNFEQFMKFESFLGPDTSSNDQAASRFTKWFRRNSSSQGQTGGSTFDNHQHQDDVDFGSGNDIRYQLERIRQQQQQQQQQHQFPTSSIPRGGFHSLHPQHRPQNDVPTNAAFRRLIDMLAANYAKNDMIAQQQYLLEVLNRGQQNENLRRMLLQAAPDSVEYNLQQQQQQQQQRQRVPTHRELQFHTQTIMQNALLRKKLQDQRKLLQNQNSQMAAAAAAAAGEPSPLVQQFVQSVCPNLQRSLSVLNQTAAPLSTHSGAVSRQQLFQGMPRLPPGFGPRAEASVISPIFSGGPTQAELSASLQQILQSPPAQSLPTQQPPSAQSKPARPQQNLPQSGRAQQTQQSQQQQQQQQQRSGRRFGKGSVTWSNVHVPRP